MVTRRDYNIRCRYWKVNKDNLDYSALIYNEKPSGVFFAKESSEIRESNFDDGGIVMIKQTNIAIETQDRVNIETKDVIEFDGAYYIVEDIQRKVYIRTTQYDTRHNYKQWFSLRGIGDIM